MSLKKCQNCHQEVNQNYCSNCGQPTDTDKFTIKYIILHDFIHGVFHLDKGYLYSIKELFTRPGHSIREYIAGKRAKHFNYFTLIVITLLIDQLIGGFSKFNYNDLVLELPIAFVNTLKEVAIDHAKLFTIGIIPLQAVVSYSIFRKAQQNFAEHLVLTAYLTAAHLVFDILLTLMTLFVVTDVKFLLKLAVGISLLKTVYSTWFFYQYFSNWEYSKLSLFLKSVFCSILLLVLIVGVLTFFSIL